MLVIVKKTVIVVSNISYLIELELHSTIHLLAKNKLFITIKKKLR